MAFSAMIRKLMNRFAAPLKSTGGAIGASVLSAAMAASPNAFAGAKGVVELYTSQGCSSCPPADELAAHYAENPDLVVLTLPVTYWDYLGWKDTFAKKEFTERQYAYAKLRGDRSVYTPQAVVNGYDHAVGRSARDIERLLTRQPLPVNIDITSQGDDVIIDVDGLSAYEDGTVWMVLLQQKGTVEIGRGENRDRKVTYTNIVREMRPLGNWNGERMQVKLAKADFMVGEANGFAVLLQTKYKGLPSNVLGAAIWNGPES